MFFLNHKRIAMAGIAVLSCLILALPSVGQNGAEPAMRTVVDELGRELRVPVTINRIVSLAPSVTETLFALGLGDKVVGVTAFCDFPPEAREKQSVGMPVTPNLEILIELRPDVIIGSSTANEINTVRSIEALNLPLYGVGDPRTVEDIFESIQHIAELTGAEQRAGELITNLRARLRSVEESVADKPRASALYAIWLEPLIAAGGQTFLSDALRSAGAEPITAGMRVDWPRLSMEVVIERNPEVLVITRAHGLRETFERIRTQPGWSQLKAVRDNRIVWLDESAFRPGPRIVDVIADLAEQLHGTGSTKAIN